MGGPADFQASYRLAWNKDALYLLIEVIDDKFVVEHMNPNPSAWYNNDAVQIFVDPFGDGPAKAKLNSLGYDENDFSYELLPMDASSAVVYPPPGSRPAAHRRIKRTQGKRSRNPTSRSLSARRGTSSCLRG